jgi:hypothetical protein
MAEHDDKSEIVDRFACDPDTLYRSIGRFVFNFSRFEDVLRWRIVACLKLNARQGNFVTPAMDFAFLCNLGKVVFQEKYQEEPTKLAEILKIMSQALEINASRIRVAHGSWYLNRPAGFAVHTSRNTFQEDTFFYKPGELDDLADRLFALRHRLWNLASDLGEVLDPPPEGSSAPEPAAST